MPRTPFSAILVLAMALPSLGTGQTNLGTVLPPTVFTRTTENPDSSSVQFSTAGLPAPFTLHLPNRDLNGEHRVSSAVVDLDRVGRSASGRPENYHTARERRIP